MVLIARVQHLLLSLYVIAGLALGHPAFAQAAPLDGLDAYIEKARNDWQVPGLAVVVVKDDGIVYAKGFGVREIGNPDRVDPDTVFAIGSATKAFTGAALAMLVDEKRIEWDGAVHRYMPSFELHDPFATRHATVRDLLSHRTGFVSGSGWLWTGSGFDRNEIIRRLRFQDDSLEFRNQFRYANEIYTAAGEIVPAVTGSSWDDFMAARFFRPLGMTRTNTSVTSLRGVKNLATPHGVVDGKLASFAYRQVDNVGGAGAINSSARDLAQLVRLQLNDGVYEGKRLIAADTLAETRAGQMIPRGGLGASTPGAKFGEYGFGWIVNEYRGRKVVQHGGAVDGMLGLVAMIPEERLGVVVLTNRLPHQLPWALGYKVFDAFLGGGTVDWSATMKAEADKAEADQAARKISQAAMPAVPAPLPLDNYVGTYSSDLYGQATVALENGALVFNRPTAAAVLAHERNGQFRARWRSPSILSVYGETPIGFGIGPAGQVSYLELGTDRFEREHEVAGPAHR